MPFSYNAVPEHAAHDGRGETYKNFEIFARLIRVVLAKSNLP